MCKGQNVHGFVIMFSLWMQLSFVFKCNNYTCMNLFCFSIKQIIYTHIVRRLYYPFLWWLLSYFIKKKNSVMRMFSKIFLFLYLMIRLASLKKRDLSFLTLFSSHKKPGVFFIPFMSLWGCLFLLLFLVFNLCYKGMSINLFHLSV